MLGRLVRAAVCSGVLIASLGLPWRGTRAAQAAPPMQGEAPNRFVISVPSGFEDEFIAFWTAYADDLNASYDFFATLYGIQPALPLVMRVYESREALYHQNLLVPGLPDGATHSHLGAREIALIAPFPPDFLTSRRGLDAVRFELNSVFLSALGANNLPAGLELGLSQYVTLPDPERQEAAARVGQAEQAQKLYTWRAILTSPAVSSDDRVAQPQAFAIVAFLADRFGFPSLVELVRAISQGQSSDDALRTVFGLPMDRLQQEWIDYLPGFLESRWQYNVLHEFDLAPFEAALGAGAYTQVERGLAAALPFLQSTGQTDKLEQARALIARAEQGIAAGNLVLQTRAALEGRLYERTLELVAQSREAYVALNDDSREAELAGYEERAQRVLDLRAELADAQRQLDAGNVPTAEAQLLKLVPQLEAVGDDDNATIAQGLLFVIYQQRLQAASDRAALARRSLYLLLGALGLALLHQATRFVYRRRHRAEPGVL